MEPLSKDQELTLSRWAMYVGRRPSESVKAFLGAEKGLSAEQIDIWWNKARARSEQGGKSGRDLRPSWQEQLNAVSDSRQSENTDFQNHEDHSMIDPSVHMALEHNLDSTFGFPQHVTQWPRLGEDSARPLAPAATYLRHNRISSQNGSRSKYAMSVDSSVANTSSMIAGQPRDSGYNSHSVRSSGYSHTASSSGHLSSLSFLEEVDGEVWEDTMEPLKNTEPVINGHLWNDSEDPFIGVRPDEMAFCSTIEPLSIHKNAQDFPLPEPPSRPVSSRPEPPQKEHKRQRSSQSNISKTSKPPTKFACTACQEPFTSKYEWSRHEGSKCEPQKHWICMLGNDPTIPLDGGGWECVFCDFTNFDRDEMINHLNQEHDINKCIRKPLPGRTKTREDKFKDHLRKVHRLADGKTHWQSWNQAATPNGKFAWGCGFCGGIPTYTWEDRLKHVGDHYENDLFDISNWSTSRVVRGLLEQNQPDFNIAEAWRRLVGAAATGIEKFEWSKENAELLKHKLEFRKGSVNELVLEARKLAVSVVQVPRSMNTTGSSAKIHHSLARSASVATITLGSSGREKPLPEPPKPLVEEELKERPFHHHRGSILSSDVAMQDASYI